MTPAASDAVPPVLDLAADQAIDDALEDLRVAGSVLFHETYRVPWTITVPEETWLRQWRGVDADTRVLVFHFIRAGELVLRIDGQPPVQVRAGEVVVCPSGVPHTLGSGQAPFVPFERVLRGEGPERVAHGTPGATELICGFFFVRAVPLNPLLGALPPVLRVTIDDPTAGPLLAATAAMLVHEIDRGALRSFSAARLLEVFCAETIRAHQRGGRRLAQGWFRGLADPRIAEAIRRIHAAPAHDWSVEALAACVSLSPSRFAARFRDRTGQSVMQYVAAWRANVACRWLRDTDRPLGEIAERIGYASLPAFSRAFKAQTGQSPAVWRRARGVAAP